MDVKPLRVRQAEATRSLLISIAREKFTESGYARTSIEEIIQQAGVAKGALYHHFDGKDALFQAVYDDVLAEVAESAMSAALTGVDPWNAARAGLAAFLDACLDPTFRRVVIVDSVVVLKHDLDDGLEKVELPMLRTVLTPLVAVGLLPGVNIEPLAHMALGALYGAALYIVRSPTPEAARIEAEAVLEVLVSGLQAHLESPE